jgi:MiaB-like tRNA modifying enzyme
MKFYFESYGCTLNSGETRLMQEAAVASGHEVATDIDKSDTVVVATCTVIEPTELKILRRLVFLKESGKKLVVTGCMPAVQADRIRERVPEAVMLPTPGQVEAFKEYISNIPPASASDEKLDSLNQYKNDVSVAVPIAEGCIGKCAYCITRLARENLHSYAPDQIIDDIKNVLNAGAREIRLTAQDIATYGMDLNDSSKLPELLKDISNIKLEAADDINFKVRVGMMNPNTLLPVLDELIEEYKSPRIFKFLHLPVQSGSNKILKAMNRQYEVELFFDIVNRFREEIPNLTLSTDVIVGFPGESEDDHQQTINMLKEIKPNIVNITRFSERQGTPSEKMNGKLHGRMIKGRSRELTELYQMISKKQNNILIDKKYETLATESNIGKYSNTTLVRTLEYRPVVVDKELELGKNYIIKIKSSTEAYLRGELL